MDIFKTDIFKTITGDMLTGQNVQMVIRSCEVEKITGPNGTIEKPVLYFEKSKRPLVLNVTNSKKLAKALGRETKAWPGAKVELYAEEISAFGEKTNTVRLKVVEKPPVLTTEDRKARRADNAELMHGPEKAIGEAVTEVISALDEAPEFIKPTDLFAPPPPLDNPEFVGENDIELAPVFNTTEDLTYRLYQEFGLKETEANAELGKLGYNNGLPKEADERRAKLAEMYLAVKATQPATVTQDALL